MSGYHPPAMTRSSRLLMAAGGALVLTAAPVAFGQAAYPSKPVKFIVPFAAGGGSDTYARLIAQKLNEKHGYVVIVDNKPGAGGNLGAEAALREPADGYTFLVISGSYAVNAILNKPAFDPIKAIRPVVQFTREANALAVGATTPYSSLKELVADAKKNPGKVAFGSPGVGSQGHVAAEYFASVAGIKVTHIPYKGTAATLADLASGQIQMAVGGSSTFAALAKAGKLRILGVVSQNRLPSMPAARPSRSKGSGSTRSPSGTAWWVRLTRRCRSSARSTTTSIRSCAYPTFVRVLSRMRSPQREERRLSLKSCCKAI